MPVSWRSQPVLGRSHLPGCVTSVSREVVRVGVVAAGAATRLSLAPLKEVYLRRSGGEVDFLGAGQSGHVSTACALRHHSALQIMCFRTESFPQESPECICCPSFLQWVCSWTGAIRCTCFVTELCTSMGTPCKVVRLWPRPRQQSRQARQPSKQCCTHVLDKGQTNVHQPAAHSMQVQGGHRRARAEHGRAAPATSVLDSARTGETNSLEGGQSPPPALALSSEEHVSGRYAKRQRLYPPDNETGGALAGMHIVFWQTSHVRVLKNKVRSTIVPKEPSRKWIDCISRPSRRFVRGAGAGSATGRSRGACDHS